MHCFEPASVIGFQDHLFTIVKEHTNDTRYYTA
jgi:hypothetical protein